MKRTMNSILMGAIAVFVASPMAAWSDDANPADRVTYTKDILPILQENCQTCHRPFGANLSGMIAPMPLMSYKEVRPWARAIAQEVLAKTMPPWHASEEFNGVFKDELTLSEDEIARVVKWTKTGAPRGNPNDAPAPIDWPETGWSIGVPDLIVQFDEANWVADEVDDLYQNITLRLGEDQVPEERWIQAIEFKPGSEAVHHMIAYASASDVPGIEGGMTSGMLGGEAPGTNPTSFAEGYGIRLPQAPTIVFQMHYHKEKGPGTGVWDRSSFAIKFHDKNKPITHPVRIVAIDHGAFEIPPGHPNWKVSGAQVFRNETRLLGYMPHLHLRGVSCKYTAYYPDGTSEVLMDVPEYDFNWQRFFEYVEPKDVPAGTRVEFEMIYDNSVERAAAIGFDAGRAVRFGGPTWDEMDLGWMSYTNTKPVHITHE